MKRQHPIYTAKHPLHIIWCSMKQRCYNSNSRYYKDYGGRGISVCDEWRHNSLKFMMWCVENGWSKELEMDRANNDGNYEPSNIRFVTSKVNSNNKRPYNKKSHLPTGVRFDKRRKMKPYKAQLWADGQHIHVGSYITLEQAHLAYLLAKEGVDPRPLLSM